MTGGAETSPALVSGGKWVMDLTELPTAEGKVYCHAIEALFSNQIVGHGMSDRMTEDLAIAALRNTLARRDSEGIVIVHADRGSQFRARSFQAAPKAAGHQGSTGRIASAGVNAGAESFQTLLQRNVLNIDRGRTRAELNCAIIYWIEHNNNRGRCQRGLGRLTPIEFERAFTSKTNRAAA